MNSQRRRISILTLGTLGSISPMAVLGQALKREGYSVSLAAPENFAGMIESMGLEYRRCGGDFNQFMKEEEMDALAGARALKQMLSWRFPGARARAMFGGALRDAVTASADADAIIFHPFISAACDIAEAKRIPAILVPLAFLSPSAESPLSLLPRPNSPLWNRHGNVLLRVQRPGFSSTIKEIRTALGLPPAPRYKHPHEVHGHRVPILYPISPVLRPGRHDETKHKAVHFTGYWFNDSEPDWKPDARLAAFLADTPKPIYIGFGSMTGLDPRRVDMLLDACEASGTRVVLGRGWGSFDSAPASSLSSKFHVLDYAPHHHLFKYVSAVVHHGGLGTLSTGLRAGRPTLACPFMLDQTYWGHQLAELKVGPKPLPITQWTKRRLITALRDLQDNPTYSKNASAIGTAMQAEDGLGNACRIIRDIVGAPEPADNPGPPTLAPAG